MSTTLKSYYEKHIIQEPSPELVRKVEAVCDMVETCVKHALREQTKKDIVRDNVRPSEVEIFYTDDDGYVEARIQALRDGYFYYQFYLNCENRHWELTSDFERVVAAAVHDAKDFLRREELL